MIVPAILLASRGHAVPLSFVQELLWLLDQLEPGNSTFNLGPVLAPDGKLGSRTPKPLLFPSGGGLHHEGRFVAPETKVERKIAGVWQELLHTEKVGVYDNFFDLGGHSLLAAQVIARIRESL